MHHYPIHELIWMVWERHRGGKRWGEAPLKDHCRVCEYITEWVVDLLWEKWEHRSFISFGVFVNKLINTDIYDDYMAKVSTQKMPALRLSPPPPEPFYKN